MITDPLLDPSAVVPSPTGGAPLDVVRRAMARWSNGEQHREARAHGVAALAPMDPSALRARARALAATEVEQVDDLVEFARFVPVVVLAESLGVADPRSAALHQRVVTRAIAPEDGTVAADDEIVTGSLDWLLEAVGGATFDAAANRVALLHQCRDATAALISLAALRLPTARSADEAIDDVLRDDPPVVSTVRIDAAGREVTVPLAGRPFGAGAHACPGESFARALAAGVLDALHAAGRAPAAGPVTFERRRHLRIPASLPLT